MKHVSRVQLLGVGGFGVAYKIKLKGNTKFYVEKVFMEPNKNQMSVISEVAMLTYDCEFMPKMYFCGFNKHGNWCLITEFIEGGTLVSHLVDRDGRARNLISSEGKRTIAYQIGLALEFLHARKLSHG